MLWIVHSSISPSKSAVANPHQIMQILVRFGCRFASAEFRADYSNVKKKNQCVTKLQLRILLQIHSFSSKICNNELSLWILTSLLKSVWKICNISSTETDVLWFYNAHRRSICVRILCTVWIRFLKMSSTLLLL